MSSPPKPQPQPQPAGNGAALPHVAIVGAGVSGLRSAEILLEHGFKVTILEARDRVGGRVRIWSEERGVMRLPFSLLLISSLV